MMQRCFRVFIFAAIFSLPLATEALANGSDNQVITKIGAQLDQFRQIIIQARASADGQIDIATNDRSILAEQSLHFWQGWQQRATEQFPASVTIEPLEQTTQKQLITCDEVHEIIQRHETELLAIEQRLKDLQAALDELQFMQDTEQRQTAANTLLMQAKQIALLLDEALQNFALKNLNTADRSITFLWNLKPKNNDERISSTAVSAFKIPGYFWNGQGMPTEVDGVAAGPQTTLNSIRFRLQTSPNRFCSNRWDVRLYARVEIAVSAPRDEILGCRVSSGHTGDPCPGQNNTGRTESTIEKFIELRGEARQ